MGGSSGSQQQQTNQTTKSSPWAPTQPLLQSIVSQLGNVPTNVSPQAAQAEQQIQLNAQGLPNYGGNVSSLSGNLLNGVPSFNDMVTGAYNKSQGALSPLLDPNNLNPSTNPQEQNLIDTINQDVRNQVGGLFAGAGRALSGQEAQAMSRGLSQGLAPTLFGQYNQNVSNMLNAAGQYFGNAQGANNTLLGNANAGVQNLSNIAPATNLGPTSVLSAGALPNQYMTSLIGGPESALLPIAGLGGQVQSNGTSNTQTANNLSPFSMITGGLGLFGSQGTSPIQGFMNFLPRVG